MGKGGGGGGNAGATTAVRRSTRVMARHESDAKITAREPAPTDANASVVSGVEPVAEKDFANDERDRPDRFEGPEPVYPTKWWHAAHHVMVFAACVALHITARHSGGFFHSLPLTLAMMWYGDAYTAVLHCALDREECLRVKILNGAARGFQAHHEFPYASTRGRGVYRMICDTHRIQIITIASSIVFGRWNAMTARVCLMKLIVSAYGGATGHFYAHGGGSTRPAWVKLGQRLRLLLHPKHHVGGHHVAPHGINFGIVNGWSNRVLNRVLHHDSPSIATILCCWAFLSLFDVAIIERCVVPGEAALRVAYETGKELGFRTVFGSA
jgi:hypothetical protein